MPGEEMGLARGAANGIRQTRHGITTRGQVCCVQRGRTKKGGMMVQVVAKSTRRIE